MTDLASCTTLLSNAISQNAGEGPPRLAQRASARWDHGRSATERYANNYIQTSSRPPSSRCMKTFVKSLPVSPQPISDSAPLKSRRDRNGPLTPPGSAFTTPDDAAATAAEAAETAGWHGGTAWRKYPADRRRLEREKKPAGPRRANRFRATCKTLGGKKRRRRGERGRVGLIRVRTRNDIRGRLFLGTRCIVGLVKHKRNA